MVITLVVDLLRTGQERLHPFAQLNQGVAIVGLLDDSRDQLTNTILVVLVHHHPLCFADPLQNHLFRRLRGDAPEVVWRYITSLDLIQERGESLGFQLRLLRVAPLAGLGVDQTARHQITVDLFTCGLGSLRGAYLLLELLVEEFLLDIFGDYQLVHPEVGRRGIQLDLGVLRRTRGLLVGREECI